MRIVLAALLALLAAAAPAAACARRDTGPRFDVALTDRGGQVRFSACDHRTGGRRLLARTPSAWGGPSRPRIDDTAQHGARVAWVTIRRHGRRVVASLATVRLPSGRRRERVIGRTLPGSVGYEPLLGVTYAADGTLAYSVWDGGRAERRRLVVGGRTVARGRIGGLETDDAFTLRWQDARDWTPPGYTDLRAPPLRDGCPDRARFTERAIHGDVLVTTARYPDDEVIVTRMCRVGSGRDRMFHAYFDVDGMGSDLRVVSGGDGRLVYDVASSSRYWGCEGVTRITVDVATGRQLASERRSC